MNILIFIVIGIASVGVWANHTENTCWEDQATTAFTKYGSLKTRSAITLAAKDNEILESKPNMIEVLEKEYNGCSLGSNGSTILRFHFDDKNKLTMMQAFRHYTGVSDQQLRMQLIEERIF